MPLMGTIIQSKVQEDSSANGKPIELDEVLFMQTRIFSLFCQRHPSISSTEMDGLFKRFGIWEFIKDGYEGLHIEGDEAIYQEMLEILNSHGVKL